MTNNNILICSVVMGVRIYEKKLGLTMQHAYNQKWPPQNCYSTSRAPCKWVCQLIMGLMKRMRLDNGFSQLIEYRLIDPSKIKDRTNFHNWKRKNESL